MSLNTNLYYSPNKVTVNMSDPAGQYRWLQDTLELSKQNTEKVKTVQFTSAFFNAMLFIFRTHLIPGDNYLQVYLLL